jgi:predicted ribosomally synthesized peptide with nif11-like leader
MSMEALREFLQKASEDEELEKKIEEAVGDEAGPDRFVALGQENGFEFSPREAVYHLYELQNQELSDDDLENVAGGTGGRLVALGGRLSQRVATQWFDRSRLGSVMHDAGPSPDHSGGRF